MKMIRNSERWSPLEILFPTKVLISCRNKEEDSISWNNFACSYFLPSAYDFFKHVLENWYPLGVRLLIQTEINFWEEEGINKSKTEFVELEEFLKQRIQKKTKKLWKNTLNQYIKFYKAPDDPFCLEKLLFKIKVNPKVERKINNVLKNYLSCFIKDQLKARGRKLSVTLLNFPTQMSALLNYLRFRLKSGDSPCGFSIREDEFLRWWAKKSRLSLKEFIPPFEKRYNFLELLLVLDFAGIIKLRSVSFFRPQGKDGNQLPITMFHVSLDILEDTKNLTAEAVKTRYRAEGGYPLIVEEGGKGYLKFGKFGKKIQIGRPNSRHFRLLKCLLDPLGVSRTIDSVFEAIKLPKDENDPRLSDWNTRETRMIELIKNAIKELQKGNKLEGKIRFEFNDTKTQIKAKLLS